MKIILDECLPKRLTKIIPFGHVFTVPQICLAGFSDTELLNALNEKKIDVFITIDNNIEYQQKFQNRLFGAIIIRAVSNRFQDLLPLEPELINAIRTFNNGTIIRIPD